MVRLRILAQQWSFQRETLHDTDEGYMFGEALQLIKYDVFLLMNYE